MTAENIIQVALPVPRGHSYDYRCSAPVSPGMRVRVPFGRRRLVGLVLDAETASGMPPDQLREVLEVLDDAPLVDRHWQALVRFAAHYYQSALGMAVATALPVSLRQGKLARPRRQVRWELTPAGRTQDPAGLGRARRQATALHSLQQAGGALRAEQIGPEGTANAVLQGLAGKGLIRPAQDQLPASPAIDVRPLTPAQAGICQEVGERFAVHLLEGVTGSGKTEVYLELARRQLAAGRQCLILVPEIGLTPQMVERVRQGTGARVVALHSGLSETERHNAWLDARDGRADIVLGTRSAVFVPLPRAGLIVVDEEHDASYKQQDGMRYHARDLAVRRGQMLDIPVLLGSATPALESQYNALQGRYRLHRLHERFGASTPPRLQIVDLRGQHCQDGLSPLLIGRLRQHLDANQQVLLFINRRGYSPVLLCHDCGWTAHCDRCDARLISHRRSRSLRCHHCGHQRALPARCPDCDSNQLQHLGQGTERIEQRVAALWPGVPRLRLDRDVLQRRGELEQALARIRSGEVRLIIGTQLMTKGHDFPQLSLVGNIDADQGLYGQDFRATEHLAQQVIQVAGRAGRRDAPGEVILQTHNPDHALLQLLQHGDYAQAAQSLLSERQLLAWPPFSRLALLRAEATDGELVQRELGALAELLWQQADPEVLGPVPAPIERKGGRYRYQLLLRSPSRQRLQQALARLRAELEARPGCRRLRWSLDMDPQFLD